LIAALKSDEPAAAAFFRSTWPQKGHAALALATFRLQCGQTALVNRTATFFVQRRMPGRPEREKPPLDEPSSNQKSAPPRFGVAGAAGAGWDTRAGLCTAATAPQRGHVVPAGLSSISNTASHFAQ
jgi:hypothetical protein